MHHLVVTVPKSMPCVLHVNILTFPIKLRISSTECPISVQLTSQVQSRIQIAVTNFRDFSSFFKIEMLPKSQCLGDRYVIVQFLLVEERQRINKGADLNVNTRSSKKGGGRIRCQGVEWMHRYADREKKNDRGTCRSHCAKVPELVGGA